MAASSGMRWPRKGHELGSVNAAEASIGSTWTTSSTPISLSSLVNREAPLGPISSDYELRVYAAMRIQ
jgi:hypothetical protein